MIFNNKQNSDLDALLYKEEADYRKDKLLAKWKNVPDIGKNIDKLPLKEGRNLAQYLENQARFLVRLPESQLSSAFQGWAPENIIRLVRLAYPNTIRNKIFTEYAMESARDSIKYFAPKYTDAQHFVDTLNEKTFATGPDPWNKNGDPFFGTPNYRKSMFETTEDRYVTELVNGRILKGSVIKSLSGVKYAGKEVNLSNFQIDDNGYYIFLAADSNYNSVFGKFPHLNGYITVYGKNSTGQTDETKPLAMQIRTTMPNRNTWMLNTEVLESVDKISDFLFKLNFKASVTQPEQIVGQCIARYDSEGDFLGEYLGEIEIVTTSYEFRPRFTSIGITITQMMEIILDTSYGVSAEEMIVDFAGQEIKKALDYRAVRLAYQAAALNPSKYIIEFDANAGDGTKDSYIHTAQTITQAIERAGDVMLNDIGRGGVSRIVGGPAAVTYLKLHVGFSDKGAQPKIGGHQVGELQGIPLFKVPSTVIPDNELLCVWKNDTNDGDVAVVFGTLIPLFSTGLIQRKNFYVEGALGSVGDWQVLMPRYLSIIKIKNLRQLV